MHSRQRTCPPTKGEACRGPQALADSSYLATSSLAFEPAELVHLPVTQALVVGARELAAEQHPQVFVFGHPYFQTLRSHMDHATTIDSGCVPRRWGRPFPLGSTWLASEYVWVCAPFTLVSHLEILIVSAVASDVHCFCRWCCLFGSTIRGAARCAASRLELRWKNQRRHLQHRLFHVFLSIFTRALNLDRDRPSHAESCPALLPLLTWASTWTVCRRLGCSETQKSEKGSAGAFRERVASTHFVRPLLFLFVLFLIGFTTKATWPCLSDCQASRTGAGPSLK